MKSFREYVLESQPPADKAHVHRLMRIRMTGARAKRARAEYDRANGDAND